MDKVKAKADLPTEIPAKGKGPIILVATDQNIPGKLMEGLATLDINVIPLEGHMDAYEKLLWASDMILILSEHPEKHMDDAWSNGVIPIVSSFADGTENYNPNKETGNCFTFDDNNEWEIFAAVVRALETFKFPYDWKHLVSLVQSKDSIPPPAPLS